jgi:hypothetical protein
MADQASTQRLNVSQSSEIGKLFCCMINEVEFAGLFENRWRYELRCGVALVRMARQGRSRSSS